VYRAASHTGTTVRPKVSTGQNGMWLRPCGLALPAAVDPIQPLEVVIEHGQMLGPAPTIRCLRSAFDAL